MNLTLKHKRKGWTISIGDKWARELNNDEAILVVVEFIVNGYIAPFLKTTEHNKAFLSRLKQLKGEKKNGN